jgi:glycerate dehydrogenase
VLDGHTVNPGDNSWDLIESLGKLVVYERTAEECILDRCINADIILTNKTPLRESILTRLPKLRLICELATGYDNIDFAAAGKLGVPVANVPEYSTDSVAQHTFALILELCNRVGIHSQAVHSGDWFRSADFSFWTGKLIEMSGKHLGIVGLGRIGRRVAEIGQAFGMNILAHNPISRELPRGVNVNWVGLEELFATADIVTLHCPLTQTNKGFVNSALLGKMKESAFLINTARGALINEIDLANALNYNKIAGAGVDVVSNEPILLENPLLAACNCFITPHIAWASIDARRRLIRATAENIKAFIGGQPINIVNEKHLDSDVTAGR